VNEFFHKPEDSGSTPRTARAVAHEKLGAKLFALDFGSEETVDQIEAGGRARADETYTVPRRDVDEAAGDVGAAGEDHTLDLGADRGERRTRLVAAIEQCRTARIGSRRARRFDKCCKPTGTGINSGIAGAQQSHGTLGTRRGAQRPDRVRERVDNDNQALGDFIFPDSERRLTPAANAAVRTRR